MPAFEPGNDFLLAPSVDDLSSGIGVSPSMGVAASSVDLSAVPFSLAAMVGVSTAMDCDFESDGNRASKSDDKRSSTTFDSFVNLDELLVGGVDAMVGVDIANGGWLVRWIVDGRKQVELWCQGIAPVKVLGFVGCGLFRCSRGTVLSCGGVNCVLCNLLYWQRARWSVVVQWYGIEERRVGKGLQRSEVP